MSTVTDIDRKTKVFARSTADNLNKVMEKFGYNCDDAGAEFGYSRTAISSYIRDNNTPVVLDKLCALMLKQQASKTTLCVVLIPEDKQQAVKSFMAALNIDMQELM